MNNDYEEIIKPKKYYSKLRKESKTHQEAKKLTKEVFKDYK